MLFPRLSLPVVRIPLAKAITGSKTIDHDILPKINANPVDEIPDESFSRYVEEEAHKFQDDARFSKGLVRYRDLKKHIKNMESGKYGSRLNQGAYVEDECPICLDPLGPACNVITTTCKHKFHTFCLIQGLGDGLCSSCPLCRNDVEKLVPPGIEGASMKLVAKMRINVDQAQWCHKQVYDDIHKKTHNCLRDFESARSTRMGFASNKRLQQLESRVQELKDSLELLERFDHVNVKGFSKICDKVGRKLSPILAESLHTHYVEARSFCADFAPPPLGKGLNAALREDLDHALGSLRGRGWRSSLFRRGDRDSLSVLRSQANQGPPVQHTELQSAALPAP